MAPDAQRSFAGVNVATAAANRQRPAPPYIPFMVGNYAGPAALGFMSDACDYFRAHAVAAVQKARALPFGRDKSKQRVVARVYHLLAKEAAYQPNVRHLEDFRIARRLESQIR